MKPSLSGRLFESVKGYSLGLDEFLRFARKTGYDGVEIRYPQLPMETPKSKLADVRKQLEDLGLTWVFGTVEGITDGALFERSLRTMDNNLSCGCGFIRCTVFQPEHIPAAQKFADEAAKRGAKLIMQLHVGTLPNNVPNTLDTFQKIGRPNIGLAFDPNHLMFDGDRNAAEAVHKLAKLIVALSVQNFKPVAPGTPDAVKFGEKTYVRALPGDRDAIDFAPVFQALKAIRCEGFATVMTDPIPGVDSRELAKRYFDYLKPLA